LLLLLLLPPPRCLWLRAHSDLQALSESQRAMELGWTGLSAAAIEGVALFLSAMPKLSLAVLCEVEGEEEIMEGDPVHCKVGSRGLCAVTGTGCFEPSWLLHVYAWERGATVVHWWVSVQCVFVAGLAMVHSANQRRAV
jgi:hypothetical protein